MYGVGNKAGACFAYYLMSQGFNLILIEREGETIKQLEDLLHRMLPSVNCDIVKVVLNKFD